MDRLTGTKKGCIIIKNYKGLISHEELLKAIIDTYSKPSSKPLEPLEEK